MASFFRKVSFSPKYIIHRNDKVELTLGFDGSSSVAHLRSVLADRLLDLSDNEQFIHSNGAPIHILDEKDTTVKELLLDNSNVILLRTRANDSSVLTSTIRPNEPKTSDTSSAVSLSTKPSDAVTLETETGTTFVRISELLSNSSVTLDTAKLSRTDSQRVVSALKQNKQVKQLTIQSDCQCVTEILAEVLLINQTLTKLSVSGYMDDDNCILISKALIVNRKVEALDLRSNKITSIGCKAISEMLKSNRTLTSLSVCRNNLGDEGIKHICEALLLNETLSRLDIYQTKMSKSGLIPVADMLKSNQTLIWLDIGDNNVGDRGIAIISNALQDNKTLIELCTKWNKITTVGASTLGDMLKTNRTLKRIKLQFNSMSQEEEIEMHKNAHQLETIGIGICSII